MYLTKRARQEAENRRRAPTTWATIDADRRERRGAELREMAVQAARVGAVILSIVLLIWLSGYVRVPHVATEADLIAPEPDPDATPW